MVFDLKNPRKRQPFRDVLQYGLQYVPYNTFENFRIYFKRKVHDVDFRFNKFCFESSKFGFSSHEEFVRNLAKFTEQLVNPRKFKME